MIKNSDLHKMTGVSAFNIRNWRRFGFIPKDTLIQDYWVDVIKAVNRDHMRLAERFSKEIAKAKGDASVQPRRAHDVLHIATRRRAS